MLQVQILKPKSPLSKADDLTDPAEKKFPLAVTKRCGNYEIYNRDILNIVIIITIVQLTISGENYHDWWRQIEKRNHM